MVYPTRLKFPTHGDCANFRNGLCILNGIAVDSKGTVCPNFTPKSVMTTPREAKVYSEVPVPRQFNQPQTTRSYPPQIRYILPPPYGYRTWYNFGSIALGRTVHIRGGAGSLFISSGRRGRGRGRMGGGVAAGPGGFCVCPSCGYRTTHVRGTPCYQQTCPKCGSRMTRGS